MQRVHRRSSGPIETHGLRQALLLVAICVAAAGRADAQATGVLVPSERVNREQIRVLNNLTRLIVDPALSSPVRSSAWAVALRATAGASEAVIQLNLSNYVLGDTSAFALSIISPVSQGAQRTVLANLDGLAGRTRGELSYTRDIAKAALRASYYLGGTLATPSFAYRSAPDGDDVDERKTTVSVKGGLLFRDADATGLMVVGARFGHSYESADATTFCRTVPGNPQGLLTCDAQIIGAPTRTAHKVVDLELRGRLPRFAAVGARVEHDVAKSTTLLSLPLWVVPDAGGSFAGGIQATYLAQGRRRWSVSVFVGQFKL